MKTLETLLQEARACQICHQYLPHGTNPVLSAGEKSRILIIGQAPGLAVHKSSIPWDDASGNNLRQWLGIDKSTFYDTSLISIMPMAFCYPGTGKSGDLPPRKECAPLWHQPILEQLPNLQLIVLIGQYAQKYYLPNNPFGTLTETVHSAASFFPLYFPLPHPSPRNNIWMAKNAWFKEQVIPLLQNRVSQLLTK